MKRLARSAAQSVAFLGTLGAAPSRPLSDARALPAAADSLEILVASTTDVHGHVRGWDYAAGRRDLAHSLAAAATVVDSLRAAAPGRVLLVDAGDMLQGTLLALTESTPRDSEPNAIIAAMNAMRYDAAAVGNHEFDFGLAALDRAAHDARFTFLAANVYRADGARAFPAWRMFDVGGARVALVGATTPGAVLWDRDQLRGKVVIRDVVPETRRAVDEARGAGAEVVVALLHSGLDEPSSYDTAATRVPSENVAARVAREVSGIDAIVFGHTHKEVGDTSIGGVTLLQPRNDAASVGVLRLELVRQEGRWHVAAGHGAVIPVAGHAESLAVLAATDAAHDRTLKHVRSAVATTAEHWSADSARVADTPIVDFVLETMRRAAGADLAANAAFTTDASFGPGQVTLGDVLRLYPYENTLRAVRVTGRQLRAYLEQSARYYEGWAPGDSAPRPDPRVPGYNFDIVSGADYALDLSRPVGERVVRLAVRGKPVAAEDTFTLAINSYRQSGGGGFSIVAGAPVVYDRGERIADLLVAEARKRGTLRAADYFRANWSLVPPTSAAGKPALRRLRILATNDLHGALEPRPDPQGVVRGGIDPLAATITRARAECTGDCVSILLDGGDEFQGTPASNLAYGRPVVELFRRLDLSASALGNHEFDWTVDTLRARIRQAPYRILGANVRYTDGRPVPWLRADTIVKRGGLRIGIVGLATPETPQTTRAVNVRGLRFDSMAPVIDAHAQSLRKRGADVVIVVAHSGAFCDARNASDSVPGGCRGEIIDVAKALKEKVDAIVSGHTHSLVNVRVNGIPIVQARSSGRALGIIDIPLGDAAGPPSIQVREVVADSAGPTPPAVDSIVRRSLAAVASKVNRVIAEIADDMPRESDEQYALGNLLADAQRWAGHGDVAIMNNGGIRADLRRGTATYGSLFEIQPFGNTLYRVTVRGRDLRAYLERVVGGGRPRMHVSGVVITYDPSKPSGSRITRLTTSDGKPLDDDRLYTMILNDFLVTGGDGVDLARRAASVTPLNIVDLDALIGYLRSLPSPVRAPAEERFRTEGPA